MKSSDSGWDLNILAIFVQWLGFRVDERTCAYARHMREASGCERKLATAKQRLQLAEASFHDQLVSR